MPGSSEAPRALSGCPCLRASRCAAAPVASAVGEAPVGLHGSPPRVRPEVAHRGWRGPVERPVEERGLGLLALRPGGMRSPTATCAPCDSVLRRVAAAARCSDALVFRGGEICQFPPRKFALPSVAWFRLPRGRAHQVARSVYSGLATRAGFCTERIWCNVYPPLLGHTPACMRLYSPGLRSLRSPWFLLGSPSRGRRAPTGHPCRMSVSH